MAAKFPSISLLTDFGTRDGYVASMKAVMYGINPEIHVVDITHEIAPQDILEAAFVLRSCFSYFPQRTIHLVVVDPTVGTNRKLLIVSTENHYFIAPDNGVLSLIPDVEEVSTIVEIQEEHFFLQPVSKTFHGRDIMAPSAAWLAKGTDMLNFGPTLENFVRIPLPKPKLLGNLLKGNVLHVDRFGNMITNITWRDYEDARAKLPGDSIRVLVGKQEINGLKEYYAGGEKGELIGLFGSAGFFEIAQNAGSAARTLGLSRGAEVGLQLK